MPQGGNLDQWGLGAGQQLLLSRIKLTIVKYILHGNSKSPGRLKASLPTAVTNSKTPLY